MLTTIDTRGADGLYEFTQYPVGFQKTSVIKILSQFLSGVHDIVFIKGKSRAAMRKLESMKFGLAFVDGSHEALDVSLDVTDCLSVLRNDGILCCHDYRNDRVPEVTKALDAYLPRLKERGDVYAVVTEGEVGSEYNYSCHDTTSSTLVVIPRADVDNIDA